MILSFCSFFINLFLQKKNTPCRFPAGVVKSFHDLNKTAETAVQVSVNGTSIAGLGRIVKRIKAYRFIPQGIQPDLQPVKLRNEIEIDPLKHDFFRIGIEERNQVKSGKGKYQNLPEKERNTLQIFLKILSNAGSYGIHAERNDSHNRKPFLISVHSNEVINTTVTEWEEPSKYFFAPFASLTTSAARLMLSLLECEVTRRGGCYVTTDTDSMMIVADETHHQIKIQGRGEDVSIIPQMINTLSWEEVNNIAQKF
jgi:hypothetical protein